MIQCVHVLPFSYCSLHECPTLPNSTLYVDLLIRKNSLVHKCTIECHTCVAHINCTLIAHTSDMYATRVLHVHFRISQSRMGQVQQNSNIKAVLWVPHECTVNAVCTRAALIVCTRTLLVHGIHCTYDVCDAFPSHSIQHTCCMYVARVLLAIV